MFFLVLGYALISRNACRLFFVSYKFRLQIYELAYFDVRRCSIDLTFSPQEKS